MAVFSPQSKAPTETYLDEIRSYLCGKAELRVLLEGVENLPHTWDIYARHNSDIAALTQGKRYTQALSEWVKDGKSSGISNVMSGILSLPLLTIIQVVQYFQFLEVKRLRHSDFMVRLRERGGIQGYCGGLMPAIAIACSATEDEVVANASKAMAIALGVGAYGELGDDENVLGPTTIVVRLKEAGQGPEIIKDFPDAHISAITDPKTVSIVGSAPSLAEIQKRVKSRGMQTQAMHLRGKVHNPENVDLAREMCSLCDKHAELQLPDASHLTAPLRSNKTGKKLTEGSLMHEAIETILASCCQWYDLLNGVCADLVNTGTQSHLFASFGIGDCIPLTPFHQAGLQITKLDVLSFIKALMPSVLPVSGHNSQYAYPTDAVAVVGMACRLPGANTVEELWDLISSGRSAVVPVPEERADIANSFRASQDQKWAAKQKWWGNFISDVAGFDHSFFRMNAREAASMDPQQRLLLETAYQAMESSGYLGTHRRESGDPVGVFLGASFVEYLDNTSANPPTAYTSTGTIRAFLSGKISYHFGWTGPSEILDTACSSSLVAINRAVKAIQSEECAIALTGGVNLITGIHNYLDLTKAGFLSQTGQCKPFDAGADGYCRSEGAGLVVLKRFNQALADGDQVLGVITGASTNQGGLSPTLTVPHSAAQVQLYKSILHQAGMKPEQVSYCEAHGTGTQAGDPLEVASVREVFGGPQRQSLMHLGSIKGNIGHCETAAGVAGLLKALVMVNKAGIPPLASHRSLNPKIPSLEPDKLAIASGLEDWKVSPKAALVNSYGAAGSNSAVLLCEAPEVSKEPSNTRISGVEVNYPIILSAASKPSLLANAENLANYLKNPDPRRTLADVAFTLVQKRQRHPLQWMSTESSIDGLIQSLRSLKDVSSAPQPKKVVLTFSGQSRPSIGMNKDWYDSFPLFRHHVDACDRLLQLSGFPSCMSAIFDKEPARDVVPLQCAMFVLQYSSAMSWIDCGLQVEAVVGHSFGELTALAVSGVLSLQDALKLVGTRAALMQSKWGPHKGTMLLIGAGTEVVRKIIAGSQGVEIACHNAPASQIVVGTEDAISEIEKLLKTNEEYRGIQNQRLSVTHGFHSQFTEPLLKDLADASRSLIFHEPKIPLECCREEELGDVKATHITQHTREPVYFYHAIRRLEQRLGACLWLEAGFDSPIIAMTKRAVEFPERHEFQDMKAPNGTNPTAVLASGTLNVWRKGAPSSFWGFYPLQETKTRQVWLPPYHFDRTSHWMPYVDHAMEISKTKAVTGISEPTSMSSNKPPRLVEPRTKPNEEGEYTMNTQAQRYIDIVSGHAVVNKPLCPAAMYMECALMAAQLAHGNLEGQAPWFENLTFEAPLGIDPDRDTTVVIKNDSSKQGMSFVVKSSSRADPKRKQALHAKGDFGFTSKTQLHRYERLVSDCMKHLQHSETETLKSKRAYGLFSRIVRYAELLKGISSITMGESEASAIIDIPPGASTKDSSVTALCDCVTFDAFIQVAGLLINSSDHCGGDEVFVATGVENFSMSLACNFDLCKAWIVYATFTPTGNGKAMGDVFILTREKVLVMVIMGVQFTKLPIARLEKLLDSATPKSSDTPAVKLPQPAVIKSAIGSSDNSSSENSSDDGLRSPAESNTTIDSEPESPADDGAVGKLKTLIASYVGIGEDAILDDATIAELGVDSLAATELADEITNEYSKEVDGGDLPIMTFGELCQLVAPKAVAKSKPKKSPAAVTGSAPSVSHSEVKESLPGPAPMLSDTTVIRSDPIEVLRQCNSMFLSAADKHGFTDYWDTVAPKQNQLVLAYIGEELKKLGLDLWAAEPGTILPKIAYLPKHERMVRRFWDILADHGIIYNYDDTWIRSSKPLATTPSSTLLKEVNALFPAFANENRLMDVTAPHFADGLSGKTDHISLLFGSQKGQDCLDDFYNNSPQLATMTVHMLNFFRKLLEGQSFDAPLRILEVGAGFGGTTKRLAEMLATLGQPVQYTFTDVSALLVKEARKKFAKYPWMEFQSLNLEKASPASLEGTYDIVIGTNVVHATSKIVESTKRMRLLLRKGGFIILSEVTRIVDWYDLVYGLLDGWWAFTDSRTYPLQPAEDWLRDLKEAGFGDASCSGGDTEESNTQQLIIGSTRPSKN